MSSISNSSAPVSVLHYASPTTAVSLPPNPSDDELAFDWTLSMRDLEFILAHRGPENLCRLAVQLCVLRKYGRFLNSYTHVSPGILGYLCRQLDLPSLAMLHGRGRDNTEGDYQREIAAYLGWHPFDSKATRWLQEWIVDQVAQHLYVDNLMEQAVTQLRSHRIILPGPSVLERTVNSAHARAEHLIFKRLAQLLSLETKQAIDQLLGVDNTRDPATSLSLEVTASEDATDFFRFAQYPPEAKAKHIVTYLQRYAELSPLDLKPLQHMDVSPELLQRLSTSVRTYDVEQLRRFQADKRYALASAFLDDARKRLLDYLVEMHAQFMTEMQRESRNAWEKEHRQVRKQLQRGVTSLRELAETVLALKASPEAPLSTLLDDLDPDELSRAVEDCVKFERLERHGLLDKLHGKYPNFRRYFRSFVHLPFAAEPGSEALLHNVALLRQLNQGVLKALPPDVDTSFVPVAWRGSLQSGESRRRRTWEVSLAVGLKDRSN